MATLSVLLPTYNEEDMIKDCLESVKWADEILVVDTFSTDHTLEIAREYGARIIQHEYINSAKQKNWAIPQCKYEWVLQIDADERLDLQTQREIQTIMISPASDIDGYMIRRKNHMFGQWIRTMDAYPGWRLSLFKRDVGRYQDKEVDAVVIVPGEVGKLQGHVLHYGFESISHRLKSLDRYTRYESDEREKQGRHYSWFNVTVRPFAAFIYYYIFKLGFLEGTRGIILAYLKSDFLFWTYAKLWEKDIKAGKRK